MVWSPLILAYRRWEFGLWGVLCSHETDLRCDQWGESAICCTVEVDDVGLSVRAQDVAWLSGSFVESSFSGCKPSNLKRSQSRATRLWWRCNTRNSPYFSSPTHIPSLYIHILIKRACQMTLTGTFHPQINATTNESIPQTTIVTAKSPSLPCPISIPPSMSPTQTSVAPGTLSIQNNLTISIKMQPCTFCISWIIVIVE